MLEQIVIDNMEVPNSPGSPESLHLKEVLEFEFAQKCVKRIMLPLFKLVYLQRENSMK